MRSTQARIALVVATVAAVVILFVVLSGGDDNNDSKTTSTSAGTTNAPAQKPAASVITVVDGKPQGGVQKLEYTKGDQVDLVVRSDTADEIHVHGYDLKKDVPKGGSARFSFKATIDGIFVIELENAGEQIGELRVSPS
jgi:hypothetical protein